MIDAPHQVVAQGCTLGDDDLGRVYQFPQFRYYIRAACQGQQYLAGNEEYGLVVNVGEDEVPLLGKLGKE